MVKELLIRALRGERVEQTPWLPHIGTHAAQLLDVSAERYLQDAELLARGAILCSDHYHIIRPLVRRGFSTKGMALSLPALEPEVTVNRDGVYWHPVATAPDLLISPRIFPLREAVEQIKEIRESLLMITGGASNRFR